MNQSNIFSLSVTYTTLLFSWYVTFTCSDSFSETNCNNEVHSTKHPLCLLQDYDKDEAPLAGTPLNISVLVEIKDIEEVNDFHNTVKFSMVFAIDWIDYRLQLRLNSTSWIHEDVKWTYLPSKWLDVLWIPRFDIRNSRKVEIKSILENQSFLILYGEKRLWYQFPVMVTLKCPMFDFISYPFDEQTCNIYIGSYLYDTSEMLYNGVMFYNRSNQRPLQYSVKEVAPLSFNHGLLAESGYYYTNDGQFQVEDEQYSYFAIKMVLSRRLQKHLFCTYLPSFLLVVCSWVGFLIEPAMVPGRIALSVTLLLVLVNMR